jgi:hypothetical protein
MTDHKKEAMILLIKIIDIGYIVVIYFILGITIAKLSDTIYGEYNAEVDKDKSTFRLCAEIVSMMWLDLILFYIVRNLVHWIPSPFHGIYGYDHFRLKELNSMVILFATYIYFHANLRGKLTDLNQRPFFINLIPNLL